MMSREALIVGFPKSEQRIANLQVNVQPPLHCGRNVHIEAHLPGELASKLPAINAFVRVNRRKRMRWSSTNFVC